ncbi:MAG: arylsulfatase [Lentisphaerae bacterium]|jgi:arylsulfatase A|nr:arylsulfatase [Lentisphaerota bacterium]MBT5605289.1 arylsulfatase [Lentisphaerota bacterium]MBT7057726.1 arylsulfatase [Lentisphaerota bacterium]MBT7844623.1 arylsulfatase [Lentisphaerota bacterium]
MSLSQPNVVYILADDMGYGDVSCLNEKSKIATPNLDRLAAGGMAFRDAHSSSAVCTPSRYSVVTGRYNWRSAMKQSVLNGYDGPLIEEDRVTVASYLRSRGYHTACIGKWHLGWNWGRQDDGETLDFSKPVTGGPFDHGFDHFYGIIASLDFPPYVYVENDRPTTAQFRWLDNEKEGYTGKRFMRSGEIAEDLVPEDVLPNITRRACSYIADQSAGEKPFFLYFPLPAPHTPILPEQFLGKSGTNEYGDFCLMVDWCVGEVMKAVEAAGQTDNTIIVFTADNGCSPMADFAELAEVGHEPSYVFRGHKADIYEGGHRIPFIARWPETIPAGTTCDDVVCLCDLFATMADIHGDVLPDHAGEDSVSNLPLWQGREAEAAPVREATVHHSINGSFSIRQGRWKLEFCPGSGGWSYPRPGKDEVAGLPPIQLYDLNADIREKENLQAENAKVIEELTALMTRYVREGRSTLGARQPNTGPAYWPQLNWMLESDLE